MANCAAFWTSAQPLKVVFSERVHRDRRAYPLLASSIFAAPPPAPPGLPHNGVPIPVTARGCSGMRISAFCSCKELREIGEEYNPLVFLDALQSTRGAIIYFSI